MTYGIIFDMDGVLLDSGPPHLKSWEMLAKENGLQMKELFFWDTFGRTNDAILPLLFGRALTKEEMRTYSDRKEELYREIVRGRVKPFPGLLMIINALFRRGWKVGVGSSGPRLNVELVLSELELTGIVSSYTCAEDVKHGKPDPEVFLKVSQKMGISASGCVVVEDSVHGIEAAHRAGMKCIAITTTNVRENLDQADLVISSFNELTLKKIMGLWGES
jgi:beta-phosphoglucomutase